LSSGPDGDPSSALTRRRAGSKQEAARFRAAVGVARLHGHGCLGWQRYWSARKLPVAAAGSRPLSVIREWRLCLGESKQFRLEHLPTSGVPCRTQAATQAAIGRSDAMQTIRQVGGMAE
jgi:hypothetical protein